MSEHLLKILIDKMDRLEHLLTGYMSVKEAAEFYGKSEKTIRNWIKTGELKAIRKGKSILIIKS